MNAAEIRAELEKVKGDVVIDYQGDCCGTGLTFRSNRINGEYVPWSAIEKVLAYIEREQE